MDNYKKRPTNRMFTYTIEFDTTMSALFAVNYSINSGLITNTDRLKNGYSLTMNNVTLERVAMQVSSFVCYDAGATGGIFNTMPYGFLIIRNTDAFYSNRIEVTGSGSDDTRLCRIVAQDIPPPMTFPGVLGIGADYDVVTFDIQNESTGVFTIRVTNEGFTTQNVADTVAITLTWTEFVTIS